MSLERIWSSVQQLFTSRTATPEARELAEIRHDILDQIRANIQELSAGQFLFPFNRVLVELRPRNAAERGAIQSAWIDGGELRSDVLSALARADCEYPNDLTIEARLLEASSDADANQIFTVICENVRQSPESIAAPAPPEPFRLTVETGSAQPESLELASDTTNLGRLAEVFDQDGQFVRRNHIAFDEAENGINETVSRTHAHILRQKDGRFALVNTRRNEKNPTAILRDGRSIPVILLPEPLERGDVIQLGRARISVS
jgi:hypothetical protein